jgi:hypothetical protein
MQPSEVPTDDDPPGWGNRDERWSIESLLGRYDPTEKKISIFDKGIEYAAQRLSVQPELLKYVVRIHEWGHAVFHLGVDQKTSIELAQASLANQTGVKQAKEDELTRIYHSAETYVHEQIAQTITRLALQQLRTDATVDQAKVACSSLCDTFEKLTKRQPTEYGLDHFNHLTHDQLQSRLRHMIRLIRSGSVRANSDAWKTLVPW